MKIRNKKDFGLGVFCILLAAWIAFLSMQLKESMYEGDPGTRMFPLIGSVILAACGIGLLIKQDDPKGAFLTGRQWLSAIKMFSLYVGFIVFLWLFGFLGTVPLALFVATYMLSKLSAKEISTKKRLLISLIYGLVGGAVLYLIYVVGLDAQMPKGLVIKLLNK